MYIYIRKVEVIIIDKITQQTVLSHRNSSGVPKYYTTASTRVIVIGLTLSFSAHNIGLFLYCSQRLRKLPQTFTN